MVSNDWKELGNERWETDPFTSPGNHSSFIQIVVSRELSLLCIVLLLLLECTDLQKNKQGTDYYIKQLYISNITLFSTLGQNEQDKMFVDRKPEYLLSMFLLCKIRSYVNVFSTVCPRPDVG